MATGRSREDEAKEMARRSLGIPRPAGKQRYEVEAALCTVQLQIFFSKVAGALAPSSLGESYAVEVDRWTCLVGWLLASAQHDAAIARRIAAHCRIESLFYAAQVQCQCKSQIHRILR